jgi:hypothetical protein
LLWLLDHPKFADDKELFPDSTPPGLLDSMEVINYMRSKLLTLLMLAFVLLLPVSIARANEVANGDFSLGSDGWTATGNVSFSDGVARLSENDQEVNAGFFQEIPLGPGYYLLEFEYRIDSVGPGLSFYDDEGVPQFTDPDLFASTLYFNLDPALGPDPIYLLQISGPSSLDPIVFHYFSLVFENKSNTVIPTFELFNLNSSISSDSSVSIDNVSITQANVIPEPGTLLSMTIGLIGLIIAGRRRFLI